MAKLKTGRHTSALKANRQAIKRTARNVATKSEIRNLVKKIEAAVIKKDETLAKGLLKKAFSEWDKAARRNVVHGNAAAHQKARVSRMVGSLAAKS